MALLALGACHRADPEGDLQQGDLIRINAVGSELQTKALLNGVDVQKAGTEVKIYDWLTGFTGKIGDTQYNNGNVMYIDDAVTCTADGNGTLVNDGTWAWNTAPWRWTRTGVHHFFGWLTKDKDGLTPASLGNVTSYTDRVLTVGPITFPVANQFDFSYSKIVEAANPYPAQIEIPLYHLFTALDVEVLNNTNAAITDLSVSFSNFVNERRTATVDYTAAEVNAVYSSVTPGNYEYGGTVTSLPANQTTAQPLYSTDSYRLLWPQDWSQEGATKPTVTVTCKIAGVDASFESVALPSTFTKMDAGTKYKLTITISAGKLYIRVIVADWTDADPLSYFLKMNTNMRLFDSWLYRYDTVNQDYSDWTNWEGSHMVVSSGRAAASNVEPVAGRPLRSPQIQLITTGVADASVAGSGTFELRVDNSDFEIIRANKNASGVVTSYEASTNGVLTIPAGDDVYTYFYIVPKVGVTPSNPEAKVLLIYNDAVTGPQKVTYNYNSLPGYSDDSSEIWAWYVPEAEYTVDGKLRMYFQDYNNPLVPVQ